MTVWIIKMEWCLPREIRIMTNGRMQIVQNNTLVRALHGGLWLSLCMQLQLWFTQSLPLGSLGKINTKLCKQHLWWYIFNFSNKWWILMDVKCNQKYLKKNTKKQNRDGLSLSLFLNKLQLLLKLIIKCITFTLHGYSYRY